MNNCEKTMNTPWTPMNQTWHTFNTDGIYDKTWKHVPNNYPIPHSGISQPHPNPNPSQMIKQMKATSKLWPGHGQARQAKHGHVNYLLMNG